MRSYGVQTVPAEDRDFLQVSDQGHDQGCSPLAPRPAPPPESGPSQASH